MPLISRERLAVYILILLVIGACFLFGHFREWPTSKFYVYPTEFPRHVLYINGKPVGAYEQHVPGWEVYCKYAKLYGEQTTNHVAIKRSGTSSGLEVVYEDDLPPGSYVVNLSTKHLVSFEEIAYGRPVSFPGLSLPPSPVGVYRIDESTNILVFDFHARPPDSMSSKHGSAKHKRYVNLKVEKLSSVRN